MFIVILCILVSVIQCEETCPPAQQLTDAENRCLESSTTFFQRVQQQASGLFATAKRKLGIDPNAQEGPLNCEFYLCILDYLGMVNNYGNLELEKVLNWFEDNAPEEYQEESIRHAEECFDTLDKIPDDSTEINCNRASEYVKCLHDFDQCPKFKYP